MNVTPLTAMQTMERDRPLRMALDHLLHRLRDFAAAMPRTDDAHPFPEHDIVWMTYPHDGRSPEATILDAIKANPALWAHAVPEECCVVPKAMLKRLAWSAYGASDDTMVEALTYHGAHLVEQHAARARYEQEEAERQRERR